MSESPDFDGQDNAEAFDETVLDEREQVGEMRTFEETPDLLDVTSADGDRDEDEALALDADAFDPDAVGDDDLEDDNELGYHAATAEREDDIDGLGPEDSFDEDRLSARDIDGLDQVRDAGEAEGGEDDVTDFQSRNVSDGDLREMGYAEGRGAETRARPQKA